MLCGDSETNGMWWKKREKEKKNGNVLRKINHPKWLRWCYEIKRIYLPANCYFKDRRILFFLHSSCNKIFAFLLKLGCQRADETNETQNNLNKITAFPFCCFFFVNLLTCVIPSTLNINTERHTEAEIRTNGEKKKFTENM